MGYKMPDGTVCPAGLNLYSSNDNDFAGQLQYYNYALRVGTITKVYLPDDTNNKSKKRAEYNVNVINAEQGASAATIPYYRCYIMTMFGGVADYLEYTLREGSTVMVLCANGLTGQSYIVGSSKNKDRPAEQTSDGTHLFFEFNGVEAKVNNDGSFTLTQKGPSNDLGIYVPNSPLGNSVIEIDNTANINLNGVNNINLNSQLAVSIKSNTTISTNSIANTTMDAPLIIMGTGATDFVMKADPAFLGTLQSLNGAFQAAMISLTALCTAMTVDPVFNSTYPAEAAAAGTCIGTLAALQAAFAAWTATVVPGVAISTKTMTL